MTECEMWKRICSDYAPYDTLPVFMEGAQDYQAIKPDPYTGKDGQSQINSQAWARGANAMMRFLLWKRDPKLYAEHYSEN